MNKTANPLKDFVISDKKARDFGFEWPHIDAIIAQIHSECAEIKQAISSVESAERVQEEIGDLLHATATLCTFCGFDLEETLAKVTQKFDKRIQAIRSLATQRGITSLKGKPTKFKLELWDQAKELENKTQSSV